MLETSDDPSLDVLDVSLTVGGCKITAHPSQLWTEVRQADVTHLIHVVSPASVTIPGEQNTLRGVLLDIDAIRSIGHEDSWEDVERNLDVVHASAKRVFFRMLADATLARLDPEYPEVDR